MAHTVIGELVPFLTNGNRPCHVGSPDRERFDAKSIAPVFAR